MSTWDGEDSVCVFEPPGAPRGHASRRDERRHNRGGHRLPLGVHRNRRRLPAGRTRNRRGRATVVRTGSLRVNYRKPTPVAGPITVRTRITRVVGKKTFMKSKLTSFEGLLTRRRRGARPCRSQPNGLTHRSPQAPASSPALTAFRGWRLPPSFRDLIRNPGARCHTNTGFT